MRIIVPCGKAAPARFSLGLSSFAGANLADDAMTIADETVDPSFLIAVFSGFSVSTQASDGRGPRPTRLSTLKSGGGLSRIPFHSLSKLAEPRFSSVEAQVKVSSERVP